MSNIAFHKLPMIEEPGPEAYEGEARDLAVRQGRNAYRAGQSLDTCPSFKDDDRRFDWMHGWRLELEADEARKKLKAAQDQLVADFSRAFPGIRNPIMIVNWFRTRLKL